MKNSLLNFLNHINYPENNKKMVVDNIGYEGSYDLKNLNLTFYVKNIIPVKYILDLIDFIKKSKIDGAKINFKIKFHNLPTLKDIIEIEDLRDNKIFVFRSDNEIECSLHKKDIINDVLKKYHKCYHQFEIKQYIVHEIIDPKLSSDIEYKYKKIIADSKNSLNLSSPKYSNSANKIIVNELTDIYDMNKIDFENRFPRSITTEGIPTILNSGEGKKKFYIKFKISNGPYELICSLFLELTKDKLFNQIKEYITSSKCLAVSGSLKYKDDNWDKGFVISVYKIANSDGTTLIKEKEIIIDKDIERVEFSIHSKMSAMNGVCEITDYIKNAIGRGYNSLAIADINNVQAFPDAFNYLKKSKNSDFKLIYGTSLEMVDDHQITMKDVDNFLKTNEYIVFDLETTGLTSNYHEIMEFGAFKIKDGQVLEECQFFVKTKNKISSKITEITKITNEMIEKEGISKKDAYERIKEFIGDLPLIAHNGANFDIKFIKKLYSDNNDKLINIHFDTLLISQFLSEIFELKWYRLGDLSRKFGIGYDAESGAHRAIYDVEILHQVIISMKEKLTSKNYKDTKLTYEIIRGESISVYARNQKGLFDLYEMISTAHTCNFINKPKILKSYVEKHRKNLIITNHEENNEIFKSINYLLDDEIPDRFKFYDFISVITPSALKNLIWNEIYADEKELKIALTKIISISNSLKIPVTAVSNAYYLNNEDKLLRKIIVNVKGLLGVRHYLYNNFKIFNDIPNTHFLTTKELLNEFKFLNDDALIKKIVITNSIDIASKWIDSKIKPLPSGTFFAEISSDANNIIKNLVNKALKEKYECQNKVPDIIMQRINKELDSIIHNNFANIYLISREIVQYSLKNNFLVGSRGSVGSSLVATLLEITEVNPLPPHYICPKCKNTIFNEDENIKSGYDLIPKECPRCNTMMFGEGHNIPFETFLGIEGNKVPDIDLNFASEFQNKAHNYVKQLFGEANVIKAGTISTVAKKTAFAFCKKYEEENNVKFTSKEINEISERIVGVKRTTGQHPGGIIVIPKTKSIYDFTPINFPADDALSTWKTSHFSYESLHDNLLKLDLLGHADPQALSELHQLTRINPKTISFYDKEVMSLFTSKTSLKILDNSKISTTKNGAIGIPEFGTNFVRRILDDTKPYSFGNLVQISGLSHGTDVWSGNAANLIQREGKKLDEIICCRDDIMINLMTKGMDLKHAFDITENVRKGKGLTPKEILDLKNHNIPDWYIDSCKKIKYMFPKAHATAYVIMAWRIAWYKINCPLEYYCVYFSTRCIVFKPSLMVQDLSTIISERESLTGTSVAKEENLIITLDSAIEMISRGYKFEQISANKSHASKFIINPKTKGIIMPFTALDGLGISNAEEIVKQREAQAYKDFEDFAERSGANKKQLGDLKLLNIFY